MNILFICTGNTCRSPMAEGYMKHLCAQAGMADFEISSAGTCSYDGGAVSEHSVRAVASAGVDISAHKSSSVTHERVMAADIIVAMSLGHKMQLARYFPESVPKTSLILECIGEAGDLADPFGGSQEIYDACFAQMKPALENLLLDLRSEIDNK